MHRQSIIRREVNAGMRPLIQFKDDNPIDNNAVALLTPNEHQIGYLNQRTAEEVRDYIAKGQWVQIQVSAATGWAADKPTHGVNILVKVLVIPVELPLRTVDFRKAVADERHEGREDQAEEWLLEDAAKREKQSEIYNVVVSSWPYEQLANLYRHQHRQADEIVILQRYFALPSSQRVTLSDKLQQRLDKQ